MSDPYASLCVHGILPLVSDEASGYVRFARIGEDLPQDCISEPGELPDCEITMRLFPDSATLKGWMEAAKEFGGNALWIVGPDRETALNGRGVIRPPCALVIRSDRQGNPGETLDDCIGLEIFPGTDVTHIREDQSSVRRAIDTRRIAEAKRKDWEREWQPELAQLKGSGLAVSYKAAVDDLDGTSPLLIEVPNGMVVGDTYDVTRTDDGQLSIRIPVMSVLSFHNVGGIGPELAPERDAFLDSLGIHYKGHDLFMALPDLGPGIVERLKVNKAEIKRVFAEIDTRQKQINEVDRIMQDASTMAFIRRIHEGNLIACKRIREPGTWMSVTGKVQNAPATRTLEAKDKGLINYAWSVTTDFDPDHPHAPNILTLSKTAKAILDGDIAAARANILKDQRSSDGGIRQNIDFPAAMAEALSHLDEDALSALRERAGRHEISGNLVFFEPWATQAVLLGTEKLVSEPVRQP